MSRDIVNGEQSRGVDQSGHCSGVMGRSRNVSGCRRPGSTSFSTAGWKRATRCCPRDHGVRTIPGTEPRTRRGSPRPPARAHRAGPGCRRGHRSWQQTVRSTPPATTNAKTA